MTYIAKPKFHHPNLPRNELGLTRRDYEGSMSTLCAGCGHDSVTAAMTSFRPHYRSHEVLSHQRVVKVCVYQPFSRRVSPRAGWSVAM